VTDTLLQENNFFIKNDFVLANVAFKYNGLGGGVGLAVSSTCLRLLLLLLLNKNKKEARDCQL